MYMVLDNGIEREATPEETSEIDARKAATPLKHVPQKVTRRQARQALLLADLLDDVEPAIEAIENPLHRRIAAIEWEDSLEFERKRPLVIQIGTALGLDDEALDNLFIEAAKL